MDRMTSIVRLLENEKNRLTTELRGITAALAAFGNTYARGIGTRKLSAAARARIAAAQRKRWAKARQKSATGQANVVPIRARKTMSAAARKKIAAAQRARWAKLKARKSV